MSRHLQKKRNPKFAFGEEVAQKEKIMRDSTTTPDVNDLPDDSLRDAVIARLALESPISTSEIGVTASEGVITLSGYVDNETARHVAETATLEVPGVRGIANELAVKPFSLLTDTDLAKTVLQVLESEPGIDATHITVTVAEGWLTLAGEVAEDAQKWMAEKAVQDLLGVRGVTNEILVRD